MCDERRTQLSPNLEGPCTSYLIPKSFVLLCRAVLGPSWACHQVSSLGALVYAGRAWTCCRGSVRFGLPAGPDDRVYPESVTHSVRWSSVCRQCSDLIRTTSRRGGGR